MSFQNSIFREQVPFLGLSQNPFSSTSSVPHFTAVVLAFAIAKKEIHNLFKRVNKLSQKRLINAYIIVVGLNQISLFDSNDKTRWRPTEEELVSICGFIHEVAITPRHRRDITHCRSEDLEQILQHRVKGQTFACKNMFKILGFYLYLLAGTRFIFC